MAYMILPALLTVVYIAYLFYLFFWKRDVMKFRAVLYPGLVFISIWAWLYYFVFR